MNGVELFEFMRELGIMEKGDGSLYFYDMVKMVARGDYTPLEAVRETKHQLHLKYDTELYAIVKPCINHLLLLDDAELESLGLHLEKRTTTGLIAAFAEFFRTH